MLGLAMLIRDTNLVFILILSIIQPASADIGHLQRPHPLACQTVDDISEHSYLERKRTDVI